MNISDHSKVIEKLSRGSNILIVVPPGASGDDLSASLALKSFLTKLEKEALIISSGMINSKFDFLPGFSAVKTSLNISKSFVIDVSTKKTQIEELSYKKEADKLAIYIKPKQGQFSSEDVNFRTSNFPFDAIVTIGVSSLDVLGDFYTKNTELFFETPVINIDRSTANESYGQFNLIILSATSNSEIVFDLINTYESSLMDQEIATSLLTGIITETNSFQHIRTTPAAFLKASQLVGLGANQQEIVGKLYKNKSLGFLKLWGRVLARIKQDPSLPLVYSVISSSDIEKSDASEEDILLVIKEMAVQLSFAKIFFFLVERANHLDCFGISHSPVNLHQLFVNFRPTTLGSAIHFQLPGSITEAEKLILDKLKEATS